MNPRSLRSALLSTVHGCVNFIMSHNSSPGSAPQYASIQEDIEAFLRSRRQTPGDVLDELIATCAAGNSPRFRKKFDNWTILRCRIVELATVIYQATSQDFVEVTAILIRHGLPTSQSNAV
ncbi:hypothetical protein BJX70DRAFT_260032 [Aspergillus crustosus]